MLEVMHKKIIETKIIVTFNRKQLALPSVGQIGYGADHLDPIRN